MDKFLIIRWEKIHKFMNKNDEIVHVYILENIYNILVFL